MTLKTGVIVTNKGTRSEKVVMRVGARSSFEFRLDGVTWLYDASGWFMLLSGGGKVEPMPDAVAGGRFAASFGVWYSS